MDGKGLGDCPANARGEDGQILGGITLRQHYAGLAMQALLAKHIAGKFAPIVAENAVLFADALLAELTQEPE